MLSDFVNSDCFKRECSPPCSFHWTAHARFQSIYLLWSYSLHLPNNSYSNLSVNFNGFPHSRWLTFIIRTQLLTEWITCTPGHPEVFLPLLRRDYIGHKAIPPSPCSTGLFQNLCGALGFRIWLLGEDGELAHIFKEQRHAAIVSYMPILLPK